jgi:hypothetical protein
MIWLLKTTIATSGVSSVRQVDIEGGTIVFDTSRLVNEYNRNWERKSYRGEVDFFAVYSKDFGKVYLVPIDEFGDNRRGFLRVDQPNRGVLPSTRWAVDFEL